MARAGHDTTTPLGLPRICIRVGVGLLAGPVRRLAGPLRALVRRLAGPLRALAAAFPPGVVGQALALENRGRDGPVRIGLSLIHISEPTRLGMISYAVFC